MYPQIDGLTGEKYTGFQLRDRSIELAHCLMELGVGVGDSVGILSLNRIEFAYVLFGSIICGATVAPLNVTYSKRKHLFIQLL